MISLTVQIIEICILHIGDHHLKKKESSYFSIAN